MSILHSMSTSEWSNALWKLVESDTCGGDAIQIKSGVTLSVQQIVEASKEHLDHKDIKNEEKIKIGLFLAQVG